MAERCRERRDDILRTHQPEPIDPVLERRIDEIVEAAERELR